MSLPHPANALLPDPTEEFSRIKLSVPHAFVSFPRTGSQWLGAVLENCFDRPCLRPKRATFLDRQRTDWLWFHDHDMDLSLIHDSVVYLYRDPVDTVYSYSVYLHNLSRPKTFIGRIVYSLRKPICPERVVDLSTGYGRHLEKWLLSSNKARTVVRYEKLVAQDRDEFEKIFRHFDQRLDSCRLEKAIANASRENLRGVAVKKYALSTQLSSSTYKRGRLAFRTQYAEQVRRAVMTDMLEPFFHCLETNQV